MVTASNPSTSFGAELSPGAGGSIVDSEGKALQSEAAAPAPAPDVLHNVTQGAHQTIDRLAEQVTPHVQRLQENVASATEMLDERADQIRQMTDEWMESLRVTVRENPLGSVAAALAIGLLVARLSR